MRHGNRQRLPQRRRVEGAEVALLQLLERVHHGERVLAQGAPFVGELQVVVAVDEQGMAQLVLEIAHGFAQRLA